MIDYNREDFVSRVNAVTAGGRCHVVYDSVGAATFPGSLDCLRPFGYFVSFGFASGKNSAVRHHDVVGKRISVCYVARADAVSSPTSRLARHEPPAV
ncbi:zinc-binding dehydrogenase [Stutzerimonas stutzeri]|uniref:zinc-binding dehydrogenase n=1 Tax=Stutzerimonas stutzeri TaxID=316 RepID=UPI001C61326C